jgi:mono/diheme cytochrome c family protein
MGVALDSLWQQTYMGRICLVFALLALARAGGAEESAKKLKNPVPYTKKSIAQGRTTFARYCTSCHGADGKATLDVMGDATDLTSPKTWKNGTTDGEIFHSIRDGQNATMPAFKTQLHQEEDIWNLVNFIHSLWPESMRPQIKD